MRTDVESGAALADAMKKHPRTFDALYSNMIAAGEAGGILDTILKRLAVYIEKNVKLKGQVKSAMIYPIAVIVIATVVPEKSRGKILNSDSFTLSAVGRTAWPLGASRRLPFAAPPMTRMFRLYPISAWVSKHLVDCNNGFP